MQAPDSRFEDVGKPEPIEDTLGGVRNQDDGSWSSVIQRQLGEIQLDAAPAVRQATSHIQVETQSEQILDGRDGSAHYGGHVTCISNVWQRTKRAISSICAQFGKVRNSCSSRLVLNSIKTISGSARIQVKRLSLKIRL